MKEDLLQFIWKFRYFNTSNLKTVDGSELLIIHPGVQNFNQGPDFLNARIQINGTLWVGNVELHLFSKQWEYHKHDKDENYKNIILHVVWHHDGDIHDIKGTKLPTLELEKRVSKILLTRYQTLMEKEQQGKSVFIPCESHLHLVPELTWNSWKTRMVAERLSEKSKTVFEILEHTEYNWEESLWQLIALNFGGKINGQVFRSVAQSIPQKILARHKDQLIAIEAMLMGQAGLLNNEFDDSYPKMLKKEYAFYKNKYKLQTVNGSVLFLRMRPANFPSLRLAQLASLIHNSAHLFSKLKACETIAEIKELLSAEPNEFWLYHYKLDDKGDTLKKKPLGKQMVENIIINTISPVLFAYGIYFKDEIFKERAINWLESINPEKNSITSGFERLRIVNKSAFDSQAFIQMKNNYCNQTRCLQCGIGASILKNEPPN